VKRLLVLFILPALALAGCKTMTKSEYNTLTTKANTAEQLTSENDRLLTQQRNIEELNRLLQKEIADKSVAIEAMANRSIKVTLQQSVLFESGDFSLNTPGKRVLDKIIPVIGKLDGQKLVRVVGHTDNYPVQRNKGMFIDNWDLSARRAAEVVRYFIWAHHLPVERFRVEGRSFVEPVASNDSEEGRAANRRIELYFE